MLGREQKEFRAIKESYYAIIRTVTEQGVQGSDIKTTFNKVQQWVG